MSRIPNAWDDDYESFADHAGVQPPAAPRPAHAPPPKISRAERRAQHAEANRALWNSAENPEPFHFVEVTGAVPLQSQPKPQLRMLSRRPKKPDAGVEAGMDNLSLQPGTKEVDDPDSEEEARREQMRTLKQRQEKAKLEREEKQRRYNERREQLFGTSDAAATAKGPGTGHASPVRQDDAGKARHGSGGNRRGGRNTGTRTPSSNDQSPSRPGQAAQRQLYEHTYSAKPDSVYLQRREVERVETPRESPVLRQPKGPDGSGRGGFGFAPRGRGRGG